MAVLDGTPYGLTESAASALFRELREYDERVKLLRTSRRLTPETLRAYYGEKRFEQVAESNALEGSPLSVGETELAVMKGVTLTGHDPAYSRDARTLHAALEHLVKLAQSRDPTDLSQIHQMHALILGERPGAGALRNQEVRISGADHRPPPTWGEVMAAVEQWEQWSRAQATAPAMLRAVVLHAWLTHIHPYVDGNGRLSRAVTNLELVRAGYPPIILRRKDRERYLDALRESDSGGDLGPLFELFLARLGDAFKDLERTAAKHQGYDAVQERIRQAYARQLGIWDDAVSLLAKMVENDLTSSLDLAQVKFHRFEERMELDDFVEMLRDGQPHGNTWCFRWDIDVPGFAPRSWLAWMGYRSERMRGSHSDLQVSGPSLFLSRSNPGGYPKWILTREDAPGAFEMSVVLPSADRWYCRPFDGSVEVLAPSELATRIAEASIGLTVGS